MGTNRGRGCPLYYELTHHVVNVQGVGNGIAFKQPARLLRQAEKPFQTSLLHPDGWSFNITNEIVKGSTNSHHNGVNFTQMLGYPDLLTRTAPSNQNNVSARRIDFFYVFRFFFRCCIPETVYVNTANRYARKYAWYVFIELFEGGSRTAVQINP